MILIYVILSLSLLISAGFGASNRDHYPSRAGPIRNHAQRYCRPHPRPYPQQSDIHQPDRSQRPQEHRSDLQASDNYVSSSSAAYNPEPAQMPLNTNPPATSNPGTYDMVTSTDFFILGASYEVDLASFAGFASQIVPGSYSASFGFYDISQKTSLDSTRYELKLHENFPNYRVCL